MIREVIRADGCYRHRLDFAVATRDAASASLLIISTSISPTVSSSTPISLDLKDASPKTARFVRRSRWRTNTRQVPAG